MHITRSLAVETEEKTKLQMTSMIDIVFLLIVFFMCVTEMQKIEHEEMVLPVALSSREEPDKVGDRIILNIMENGEYRVSGRLLSAGELRRTLTERAVSSRVDGETGVSVKIRADAGVAHKYVQGAMLACSRAKIRAVSFGVSPGKQEKTRAGN